MIVKVKTHNISNEYKVINISQLDEEGKLLIKLAEKQAKKAYAPYSDFYVGAAVLLDNGEIVTGSNQENASYPLSLCAERVALFAAHSQYPGIAIRRLAVIAINPNNKVTVPISPCGACRQVIRESEIRSKGDLKLILKGETDKVFTFETIKVLLPLSFDSSAL